MNTKLLWVLIAVVAGIVIGGILIANTDTRKTPPAGTPDSGNGSAAAESKGAETAAVGGTAAESALVANTPGENAPAESAPAEAAPAGNTAAESAAVIIVSAAPESGAPEAPAADPVSATPAEEPPTASPPAEATPAFPAESAVPVRGIVIDHTCIRLDLIPAEWAEKAKKDLHIAYGHTSHGSQLTTGLQGLTHFKGSPFIYDSGVPGSLDLRDNPFGGGGAALDLGQPDNKTWAEKTRAYLNGSKDVNVVMWSWCGQLSGADDAYVDAYLRLMQELEAEFPQVAFVYMTGHLDGSGENGTLAKNNQRIRDFCAANNKILYDFADIESYNPDGEYFGDRYPNDACDYGGGAGNWAVEWQAAHEKGTDWYECEAAHSQPLNANMKAYAAWWLFARLAGWDGRTV